MNISTGIYRLAQIIKWAGRGLGWLWLMGLAYSVMGTDKKADSDFWFFVVLLAVFIAITEGTAWVLEGFSND